MLPKTFIFFAITCVSVASAAGLNDNVLEDFGSVKGNGNYIIHLRPETSIKTFVPKFINEVTTITRQIMGSDGRVAQRSVEEEHFHIYDTYSIGDKFKGLTVKFDDARIIETLAKQLSQDILKVIPDQDIQFDLPKPKNKKRFLARSEKRAERKGNFDADNFFEATEEPQDAADNEGTAVKRAPSDYSQQNGAQWNLVRISERALNLNKPYIYPTDAGSKAFVYVVDDGMRTDHVDFGGRAQWGWSAYSGISRNGGGHGTHVSGIIGGSTYGVAKKANLVAVQVLDESGSGSVSSILSGLQWVASNNKKGRSVVNMSLGMRTAGVAPSAIAAMNDAIDAVVSTGVPVVVAAGNWANVDACDISPANNRNVFTVGATNRNDRMASFSSAGPCVKILAPGENILSTYKDSSTSTAVLSGTSMASPHVAGVAALLVSQSSYSSASGVYQAMSGLATSGVITAINGNTVNKLLFNGQQLSNA
ncbi:peptidase S8/S53 domain-containing protein [Sporodiniella umbellata]|nr:peptidase S8/S53 domain-containing protein [Sporodiniella umbellata]